MSVNCNKVVTHDYEGWQIQSLEGEPANWITIEVMLMLQFKSKGKLPQNFLLLRGGPYSVLFSPLTDWTRPTHIMESKLLYSSLPI